MSKCQKKNRIWSAISLDVAPRAIRLLSLSKVKIMAVFTSRPEASEVWVYPTVGFFRPREWIVGTIIKTEVIHIYLIKFDGLVDFHRVRSDQ